jgi:ribose transport system substrate-binding protein
VVLNKTLLRLTSGLVAVVCLAACSTAGGGAKDVDQATIDAGVEQAQTYLDSVVPNPTGIGYDTALESKPPTGKRIVALETPVAVAKVTNDYRQRAADLLGWNMTRIIVGNGPEDASKAMEQALDSRPDAIFYSGYDPSVMSAQLDRARTANIPVIAESVPIENPAIIGTVRDAASNDRLAQMSAAYVIGDSEGKANIEFFSVPSQPIITTYYDSFRKYIEQWCPACSINVNNFEYPDIGSNLPGQVVSSVQRNPNADYLIFGLGDALVGVEAALQSAGLDQQVKIGGAIPSLDNYEALRKGTQAFWAADAGPTQAWRETDLMVRAMQGTDLTVVNDAPLVSQLLTSDNIGGTAFDNDGYWLGYPEYVDAYKALWGI